MNDLQTHILKLANGIEARFSLERKSQELVGCVEVPKDLTRKRRRLCERWMNGNIDRLKKDPRPLHLVVVQDGKIIAAGSETSDSTLSFRFH